MTDPTLIKHQGSEHAAHPLYRPLPEQWEGWTAAIQRLKPRQLFVRRLPPKQWLLRHLQPPVAKLRTPDLPDPIVDAEALAAVEGWYLAHCFEVRPVVEAALANLRPDPRPLTTRRRGKVTTDSP